MSKKAVKLNSSKRSLYYHLGNTLILLSLVSFLFFFYPFIQIYLFPPQIKPLSQEKGYFITIPKIHAQAPVIRNVDPWNIAEYTEALHHGVAQAKPSTVEAKNTLYFFAHSSSSPWDIARFNTIFLRLGELEKGDEILLQEDGKKHAYRVTGKKEIFPTEVAYLIKQTNNSLILQTCTPIGTSYKRLLVFAKPTKQ